MGVARIPHYAAFLFGRFILTRALLRGVFHLLHFSLEKGRTHKRPFGAFRRVAWSGSVQPGIVLFKKHEALHLFNPQCPSHP